MQKCVICGEWVQEPVYRRFRRYVNFPVHPDLRTCKENLMEKNFLPLFEGLYPFVQRVAEVPEEYWHFIEEDFFNPECAVENAVRFVDVFYDDYDPDDPGTWHGTKLWNDVSGFIDAVFPTAQLVQPSRASMRPVNLKIPATAFQKLLALELLENSGGSEPMWLGTVSQKLFLAFQTGKMPLDDFQHGRLPSVKSSYMVLVPQEMDDLLADLGLGREARRYDSVFLAFSRMVPTTPKAEELAFRVMKRKIAGTAAVRKAKQGQMGTVPVNYLKVPGLPKDKNKRLSAVLESRGALQEAVQLARELEGGTMSSMRCDPKVRAALKQVADEENVPLYRLITACLIVTDSF